MLTVSVEMTSFWVLTVGFSIVEGRSPDETKSFSALNVEPVVVEGPLSSILPLPGASDAVARGDEHDSVNLAFPCAFLEGESCLILDDTRVRASEFSMSFGVFVHDT